MGLKREYAQAMENAGFTKRERQEFANAHTIDGKPMDIDTIFHSIPFQNMMKSRRDWWEYVLKPVELGGKGWTYEDGERAIDKYYKSKKTKIGHNIWSFLKAEYRPPSRIKSERAFKIAISSKASIARSLFGKYSTPIKRPVTRKTRCSTCNGTGSIENIYHKLTTCLSCGGSGYKLDNR